MDISTDEYYHPEGLNPYFDGNNNQQTFYNPPGRRFVSK